jgi:hypothetical protein
MSGSVSRGRVFRIPIQWHFAVLNIFGLTVVSLASAMFPAL